MWIVFHAIFWDGNAANKEDIIDSLLSPGNKIRDHDKYENITTYLYLPEIYHQLSLKSCFITELLPHILTHSC